MLSQIKKYYQGVIIIVLVILLLIKGCQVGKLEKEAETARKTDTVYVPKPYKVIEIKEVEKPVKVYVYMKRDTALRKQVEKEKIVLDVELKKTLDPFHPVHLLKITTVDTMGLISKNSYVLRNMRSFHLNSEGKVEIKRKRFKWLKIGGVAVLVAITAYGVNRVLPVGVKISF